MNIELRAATAQDAKAVRALVEVVLPATYDPFNPDYAQRELAEFDLADLPEKLRDGAYVLATLNDRVIGLASAVVDDQDRFVMSTLHVHPDHQGSRLGSRLLTEVLALADDVPLWTRYPLGDDNAAAFCARHGFVPVDEIDDAPYGVVVWVRRDPA
ncbi:GNAT family N-acetyltransferase [Nocardioides yefusunii]|uniref:GNAT family N-acetyltransferase n=1 Tax=Nocardioides yefusunii TaxID=2500546 RepID=A0ABW1QWD3_9ACTN|nr:GNAT family N-acetyltransferase [Nocardioides yefusunii]